MKKFFYFMISLLVLSGCVKDKLDKKNNEGKFECNIEGNINVKFQALGGCDKVFANYIPGDASTDFYNILVVEGFDGKQILGLHLYFKGSYPSNPVFQLGIDGGGMNGQNSGMAQFIPNALNSALTFYSTDDRHFGTCNITEYDQVNQRISGTFEFDGQFYNNGAQGAGATTSLRGSFANVPINDMSDPNNPMGPCFGTNGDPLGGGSNSGGNSGGNNGNNSTSTITFTNNVFTPIDITFQGQTKSISVGGKITYSGKTGTAANGSAITSGKTSSGSKVGLNLSWNLNASFPSSNGGNTNYPLNAGADLFFLKMQNKSGAAINKVYVNYGLTNQTLDNISLPSDNNIYSLGYYKAFTNSNVRAESGSKFWQWNSFSLPFTPNQVITLTANP